MMSFWRMIVVGSMVVSFLGDGPAGGRMSQACGGVGERYRGDRRPSGGGLRWAVPASGSGALFGFQVAWPLGSCSNSKVAHLRGARKVYKMLFDVDHIDMDVPVDWESGCRSI